MKLDLRDNDWQREREILEDIKELPITGVRLERMFNYFAHEIETRERVLEKYEEISDKKKIESAKYMLETAKYAVGLRADRPPFQKQQTKNSEMSVS